MNATNDILRKAKDSATESTLAANAKTRETLESVLADLNKSLGSMVDRLRGKDVNHAVQTATNTVSQHPWYLASGLAIGIGVGIGVVLLTKSKH